jgi:hypothetical protein
MGKNKLISKLYLKRWVIGITHGDIKEIIRTKTFNQDIKWLPIESKSHFFADPFILESRTGITKIIFEDFSVVNNYGNISLMTLDRNLKEIRRKVLLDTKSHLSFPFIFTDDSKMYVIPESVQSGRLSVYEYDPLTETMRFIDHLLPYALYDPVLIWKDGKYWLFGSIFENREVYKMHIFYSDRITGPYIPHPGNPVKSGLDGIRGAGHIIEVDNELYRPAQNCANSYGESITINRITRLDEIDYAEESYMEIKTGDKDSRKNQVFKIHTLNVAGDLIVVDGMRWVLGVREQWKNFRRNRKLKRQTAPLQNSPVPVV